MALPWNLRRSSRAPAPDYSAKDDTKSLLSGQKKSFSEVHYRPTKDDSKERCSECINYLKPGQPRSDCRKVIGVIEAEGLCDLWQQRQGEPSDGKGISITIQLGQGS